MDETNWPNVPDSIAGMRAALQCGYGLQYCVGELRMYLSQLEGALWSEGANRKPIEVLREHGLAADILAMLRDALQAELVHDEDDTAVIWAIWLLGRLGPAAVNAVPALREASASGSDYVAEQAATSLRQIGVLEEC